MALICIYQKIKWVSSSNLNLQNLPTRFETQITTHTTQTKQKLFYHKVKNNQRNHSSEWTFFKNCIFGCLKYHKGSIIVWIVIYVFGIFSMSYKVSQNLTQMKFFFTCSKHLNLDNGQFLSFSNIFFSTKCAPFLLKIEEDFNIYDQKGKRN